MRTLIALNFVILITFSFSALELSATTYFVKTSGNDTLLGTSWEEAFQTLNMALSSAMAGDEIWVAAGTYYPTTSTDRNIHFVMKEGVGIYGGFVGAETMRNERDWNVNITILSGDIGQINNKNDNSYNIIFNENNGLTASAVLDGFTLTGGNSNLYGAAIYNLGASPSIYNCRFVENYSNIGGTLSNIDGSPYIENCLFLGNESTRGGGIYNKNSNANIINCGFLGNNALYGGAIYTFGGVTVITNCSVSGNSGNYGGIYNEGAALPVVTNCIVWGNGGSLEIYDKPNTGSFTTVTFSIVEGGFAGTGNLDEGPFFVLSPNYMLAPTTVGNLKLQDCSPAIDAGTISGAPMKDFEGDARPLGGGIDIGFDENISGVGGGCCPSGYVLYVDSTATGLNDGTSWKNAFTDLQDALFFGKSCTNISEIWVAKGTYYTNGGTERAICFAMYNNLGIYGGFSGNEFLRHQRNWLVNETILSADIGVSGEVSDNSFHVIFNRDGELDETSVIDGFTLTGGNANGPASLHTNGGGIYNLQSAPTIKNCRIVNNSASDDGGGIRNNNFNALIENCVFMNNSAKNGGALLNYNFNGCISHCEFIGNIATSSGGAIDNNTNGGMEINSCSFRGNSAGSSGGAIMCSTNTKPVIVNCEFIGNTAATGGAIRNSTSNPTPLEITNSSFSGNLATNLGGGLYNNGKPPIVKNCIFWGNDAVSGPDEIDSDSQVPIVSYSIVQGGFAGISNLNQDPLFVDQPLTGLGAAGNLHVLNTSPAVDAGTASNAPMYDYDRQLRPTGNGYDIGFDEQCDNPAGIIYVDSMAAPGGNGTSWSMAFQTLSDAINSLGTQCSEKEIWVAKGTYYPTDSGDRTIAFSMPPDMPIYGGFLGTETMLSQRDWELNETILSGDIGTTGYDADNSHHVIFNNDNGLGHDSILDGFTITNGNANGSGDHNKGGGVFNKNSSPQFTNCRFIDNFGISGGGAFNYYSEPFFINCEFLENEANHGAGIDNNGIGSPLIVNCYFAGNAASFGGGGVYNHTIANARLINCAFVGNTAGSFGGAIRNVSSNPSLINCSISGNAASSGGGAVYNFSSNPIIDNCILWGNSSLFNNIGTSVPVVSHSIMQGGYPGIGNLNVDPLFLVQPPVGLGTSGDLRLQSCSPAIDAGYLANPTSHDLADNLRYVDATGAGIEIIDMGSYEYQNLIGNCNCIPNLFVSEDPIPEGVYESEGTLTSASARVASGTSVIFTSDTGILILDNFTVELGGEFEAIIQSCTGGSLQISGGNP